MLFVIFRVYLNTAVEAAAELDSGGSALKLRLRNVVHAGIVITADSNFFSESSTWPIRSDEQVITAYDTSKEPEITTRILRTEFEFKIK
jgi:hypothetical protein